VDLEEELSNLRSTTKLAQAIKSALANQMLWSAHRFRASI
jgi:hypothetical protein